MNNALFTKIMLSRVEESPVTEESGNARGAIVPDNLNSQT
jgi:hypothetical protein